MATPAPETGDASPRPSAERRGREMLNVLVNSRSSIKDVPALADVRVRWPSVAKGDPYRVVAKDMANRDTSPTGLSLYSLQEVRAP